jgi:hypothetical protein
MFLEDGSPNWDHPLTVPALSGDFGAFIQPPDNGHFGAELRLWYTCSALCPSGCTVLIQLPSLLRPRSWCGPILWGCLTVQNTLFPLMRMAPSTCGHRHSWLHQWHQGLPLLALLGRVVVVQRGIPHPLNGGINAADHLRAGLVWTNPGLVLQHPCSWASAQGWSIYVGPGPSMCSPLWDVTFPPPLSHGAPGHHWLWGL